MDYAQQLADFAHILEQKRLVTALEGNASVIDRQTGLTYVTPSGRMKLLLEKEDICVMNAAGEQIGGRGRRSSEYLLHEAVYQARPDVTAVVHSHCPFLTAYALRYQNFDVPETCSLREVFTHFTCLPYGKPGTHEIHRGIGEALGGYKGYGYAMIIELLSAILQDGWYGKDLDGKDENGNIRPYHLGHFFIAIDTDHFMGEDVCRKKAGDILRAVRASQKAPGCERIYTAGEKEHEIRLARKAGVPINDSVQKEIIAIRDELGLNQYHFPFED